MVLVALDTNVVVYAESMGEDARCRVARELIQRLPETSVVLPVQVLGEFYRVLTGKRKLAPSVAKETVLRWSDAFAVRDSTWSAMQSAFELSAAHGLSIWDSLILSVAADQRCRMLLTEDMQAGFTWRGTTVVNPFAVPAHPLLAQVLNP